MRNVITNEWLTIFTLIGIVFIALAKSINPVRFRDFLFVIANSKYLKIYSNDRKLIDIFSSLLFVNLSISLSIFIYFTYSIYIKPLDFELTFFLKLLLCIAVLFLAKPLIENYIAKRLKIHNLVNDYLFQKTTYRNYFGLIFLVTNLFLIYTQTAYKITLITITLAVICLTSCMGFITSFKYHQKTTTLKTFYFLLYLCTFDIAPYIILYKVFNDVST